MNILVFFYLNPTATRNVELLKRKGGKKNGEWIVDIGTF